MDKVVITIARSYGSGGRTLGKMLSHKLGIPCYDREILRLASDESGIAEELFAKADEKVRRVIKSSKGHYTGKPLPPENADFVSDDNLFEIQAQVIRDLASQESCIIVGRCADFILKDMDHVISLYLYASEEDCLARLKNQISGTEADLRKRMASIDKYRADYYKYYAGHSWNDACNYDLCINTGSMSYEKLIEVVEDYIRISAGE